MSDYPFVAADIGGTNARFVRVDMEGGRLVLRDPIVFRTEAHTGVEEVWREVLAHIGSSPRGLGLSVAGPTKDGHANLTNAAWSFDEQRLALTLGLDHVVLVNDLEAVAHCAAHTTADGFETLKPGVSSPDRAASLGILGLGTGFGFARAERFDTKYKIVGTEAGHAGFAPSNWTELELVEAALESNGRVSNEVMLSGDGLLLFDDKTRRADNTYNVESLWRSGLDRSNSNAARAVDRFCGALGSVIGDIVLAQGLEGIVLAGGVVSHIRHHLPNTDFLRRFEAKAPMGDRMDDVGIFTLVDPEPGLTGAAICFRERKSARKQHL